MISGPSFERFLVLGGVWWLCSNTRRSSSSSDFCHSANYCLENLLSTEVGGGKRKNTPFCFQREALTFLFNNSVIKKNDMFAVLRLELYSERFREQILFRDDTPSKEFPRYFNFIYKVVTQTFQLLIRRDATHRPVLVFPSCSSCVCVHVVRGSCRLCRAALGCWENDVACTASLARPVTLLCPQLCSFLTLLTFL